MSENKLHIIDYSWAVLNGSANRMWPCCQLNHYSVHVRHIPFCSALAEVLSRKEIWLL